jgi:hypothetical protein
MPSFYPEGSAPLPTDSQERSLVKAVSLLGDIVSSGGGGGSSSVVSDTYELKSANFTAEVGKSYAVDTTAGVVSVTLPPAPATGETIKFADARGTWMTNAITILRNGKKIEASEVNFSNNASGSFFSVVYIDSTTGWRILTSGTKPLNINPPAVSGVYDFSATSGTWTGNPTTFTYQWQMSDDGETEWADIEDETSSTYLALEADEGKFVRVGVIATNSNGSSVIVYSPASSAINLPDFPTTGLLAFWKLDDLTDSSGNGYTLTNNNTVTFGAGKIGDAAVFNGSNYLNRSLTVDWSQDFSISFWVLADNVASYGVVFNGGGGESISCNYTGSNSFDVNNGASGNINFSFTPGAWRHVVVTKTATDLDVYVDGAIAVNGTPQSHTAKTSVFIGRSDSSANFTGKVDALGIWNRDLTSQEIAQLYNNGNGVEPA